MLNELFAPSGKHSAIETVLRICNWRIIILCGRDCLYLYVLYDAKYILSPRNNMNYYLFIYGTSGDNNLLETCTAGESI